MNGKLDWPRPPTSATSLVKHPVVLAGIAVLAVGIAAAGAWLTQPPETAPPRVAKSAKAKRAVSDAPSAAVPAASIVLQDAEPPPEPTNADFARSGDAPATATPSAPTATPTTASEPPKPTDWVAMPIDDLRARANAEEITAMEELARRLIQGVGVTKDQQAGAGWLLRAAQQGSAQSAFNVAVMHERGFVVERDSTKAVEWYRKAVASNLPMAKHNLALLLRDGKGAPRNGREAVELLRSAARQGMAASMFTLGDIYERGDAAPKDAATAMAWFAITAEFERQTNRDTETALAKTANQRTQTLRRILTPAELERAQQLGQGEFKLIVEALSPPKPPPAPVAPAPAETAAAPAVTPPPADVDPPGWPKATNDQVRVIQQALVDLKLMRDKPDGAVGPVTRAAIRAFQRSIAMRETGEPTREVYAALKGALADRDIVANSPLPPPAKTEPARPVPPKVETPAVELPRVELPKAEPKVASRKSEAMAIDPPKAEAAKPEAKKPEVAAPAVTSPEPPRVEAAKVEPPKSEPPKSDLPKVDPPKPAMPKIETVKPPAAQVAAGTEPPKAIPGPEPATEPAVIDIGPTAPPPPPLTSAEIARAMPKESAGTGPVRPPADSWPTAATEQVRAIQKLLRDLNFSRDAPDGLNGPSTRTAIRDYERAAGLPVTGEPSKALFESLRELHLLMAPKFN